LQERRQASLCFLIVRCQTHEHADAPHSVWLLRARGKRPSRCAPNQREKIASSHRLS
jgi:hypothetical protein